MAEITQLDTAPVNATASAAALSVIDQLTPKPTSLIRYHSSGRVVVIGGAVAQEFALRLSAALSAQVLLTEGAEEPGVATVPVGHRNIDISGYLGNFHIHLGQPGQPNFETVTADIILDLNRRPLVSATINPPGYLTCIAEEPYLTQIEAELNQLTGTFEKPKYFDYDPSICAHGRSGVTGCCECIDACPADAITSLLESVEIDPHRCQGGGVCASVCPSGAVRYVYPNVTDTLHRVRTLLSRYTEAGGSKPVIGFVAASDSDVLEDRPANLLPVLVEELASVGIEVWLSALAYGASRVLLVNGGSIPAGVDTWLRSQLDTADSLVQGLGYPAGAIRLVDDASLHQQCAAKALLSLASVASYGGSLDKRRTALQAVDYLYQQSESARDVIALPQCSPFGRIAVEADACTLCMSCTSVCPANALSAGNDEPRLEFHEINCVQCGICASACPEHAITLEPRLIADAEQRRRMVVLHQEPPFCCIRCGKPFATRSMIDTMTEKLAGHYMFQSERARQRLLMCEDCRVADVVQDETAMRSIG